MEVSVNMVLYVPLAVSRSRLSRTLPISTRCPGHIHSDACSTDSYISLNLQSSTGVIQRSSSCCGTHRNQRQGHSGAHVYELGGMMALEVMVKRQDTRIREKAGSSMTRAGVADDTSDLSLTDS